MSHAADDLLAKVPAGVRERLERTGFDSERFRALSAQLRSGAPEDNVVRGRVTPPEPDDVATLPPPGSRSACSRAAWPRAWAAW